MSLISIGAKILNKILVILIQQHKDHKDYMP
jgi:hypothetical protein